MSEAKVFLQEVASSVSFQGHLVCDFCWNSVENSQVIIVISYIPVKVECPESLHKDSLYHIIKKICMDVFKVLVRCNETRPMLKWKSNVYGKSSEHSQNLQKVFKNFL